MYILRFIWLSIVLICSTIGILYCIVNPTFHWIVRVFVPILLFIIMFFSVRYLDYIRCNKCKHKCYSTGIAGTNYKQYYCSKCQETKWVDFNGDYH